MSRDIIADVYSLDEKRVDQLMEILFNIDLASHASGKHPKFYFKKEYPKHSGKVKKILKFFASSGGTLKTGMDTFFQGYAKYAELKEAHDKQLLEQSASKEEVV